MHNVGNIIKGTTYNLLDIHSELYKQRISICRNCKLIKKDPIFGEVCSSTLYINPQNNETSDTEKPGFINGCGCILRSKARVSDAHCPIKRW